MWDRQEAPVSFPDEKDKGCHAGEWDVYAVWIGNDFPWLHVSIALFSDVVDVAFTSYPTSSKNEKISQTFI